MKKILIIDDSPFIFKEVSATLEGLDYEIVGHAKSGEEGLSMAKELKPDIITLDIVMPGIDGIETAQKLIGEFGDIEHLLEMIRSAKLKSSVLNILFPSL